MISVDDFRAEARGWLEANVPLRTIEDNPAVLFPERADEAGYVERSRHWQARVAEAGFTGITWPKAYGGRDLTPIHQIAWTQESARYDLPVEIFGIGIGMGGPTVLSWGTDEQKERWLRPMLRGEEIWCQLFSEPNAGSDVASVQTRAVRDGDEWVVNGQKVWTSGAHYSKWGMLIARSDPDVPKHGGMTYFIIDMEQPGVVVRPLRQMTGGSNFTEVFFDDARVPADAVLGSPGMGWSIAVTTLMNERASIGALGALAGASGNEALLRLLAEVARVTGVDPRSDPVMRDRAVDIMVRTRVLAFHAGRIIAKIERGEIPTAEGSVAKLAIGDLLDRIANFAVEAQGGRGMLAGADALAGGQWTLAFLGYPGIRIAGGTDEIMRNIIGERVLDLPREPRTDREPAFAQLAKNT
ncbi:MAG TPA: acyl-CoA dehydrogenase family protein [Acidimicrobiia bacterium]|nr:acyl-CoA dehydrogenase family protein [Acidimicrobiia bacterium]